MLTWLEGIHPITQAFVATIFTWLVTAAGAGAVFLKGEFKPRILDAAMGFAAGVMIAASFWSLLAPAIEMAGGAWFPAAFGFVIGGGVLWSIDKVLPHLHPDLKEPEGLPTSWRRSILLVLAITLHNIPEGLAIGVAFGAAAAEMGSATVGGALALALGIGIQNFPEGMAVSMPLRREGLSRLKSFFFGQISATVEPVAGVLGAFAVTHAEYLLPYALGFAAGAMIFVVVEELIPESQRSGNTDLATVGTLGGFTVMMILDVALG